MKMSEERCLSILKKMFIIIMTLFRECYERTSMTWLVIDVSWYQAKMLAENRHLWVTQNWRIVFAYHCVASPENERRISSYH